MNIFILDENPRIAAQMQCNKHVVKMILETRELLIIASYENANWVQARFKRYSNHPCAKWARASRANFLWLWDHGKALCKEYTYRYNKVHMHEDFFGDQMLIPLATRTFDSEEEIPFVQCMPLEYQTEDPVEAYRNYYKGAKTHLLTYTKREIPFWLKEVGLGVQK